MSSNLQRGFLRLWLVISAAYIAISGSAILHNLEELNNHDRLTIFYSPLCNKSDSQESSKEKKEALYAELKKRGYLIYENGNVYSKNKEYKDKEEFRTCLEQAKEQDKSQFRNDLIDSIVNIISVPALLLLLFFSVNWVIKGFKK